MRSSGLSRKVLVTGGAGYIGSHVCKRLAQAGFQPVVFDNLEHGHRAAVKWGPLEVGDVRDPDALGRALETHDVCAVMHFAAYISVGESVSDPDKYRGNNVGGTKALLAAMAAHRVPHLIFSSTAAVYGEPDIVPIPVDAPIAPVNPYGESKVGAERAIVEASADGAMTYAILRYFNAAGADPDGEIGECHEPETHLIPLVLRALRDGLPARVFGTDYDTPDGSCVRDYIHVTDLADAHLAALRHLLDGGSSTTCNLGTGRGTSVLELLRQAEEVTGRVAQLEVEARRPGDPPSLVADPSSAKAQLQWSARHSDIASILQTAWRWENRDKG